MDGLVSIVIPCFNYGRYIGECISSVTEQTWRNIEIIVYDDGSTDCTSLVVKQFQSLDDRVMYYRQENAGYPSAHNKALALVKGEYLMVLDADDSLASKSCIEQLVNSLSRKGGAALAYGLTRRVDEHGQALYPVLSPRISGPITSHLVNRDFIPLGSMLANRKVCSAIKFDERLPYMQDYLYKLRVSAVGNAVFVDALTLNYRVHSASVSCNQLRIWQDTLESLKIAEKELRGTVSWWKWATAFSRVRFELGKQFETNGGMQQAILEYARAITAWPLNWKAFVLLVGAHFGGLYKCCKGRRAAK